MKTNLMVQYSRRHHYHSCLNEPFLKCASTQSSVLTVVKSGSIAMNLLLICCKLIVLLTNVPTG